MESTNKEQHNNVLIDEFVNALALYVEARIALALNNRHHGDSWYPIQEHVSNPTEYQDIPGKYDELLKAVVNLMRACK